uniref:Ubiquitin-like protein ATG12 n=1 Tax=Steinernema glaseri TaxID=37863 RepID=A0A1I7ZBB8_9BILA
MLGSYSRRPMYKRSFQESRSFAERRMQFQRVQHSNPDRIPVIIERYVGETTLPDIDECRFLVHPDSTITQLTYLLRRRMQLTESQTLTLFVNDALVPANTTLQRLQSDFANEDGFIYFTYASQSAFG